MAYYLSMVVFMIQISFQSLTKNMFRPYSENVLNDSGYESSSNENSTSTNLQQSQNLGLTHTEFNI